MKKKIMALFMAIAMFLMIPMSAMAGAEMQEDIPYGHMEGKATYKTPLVSYDVNITLDHELDGKVAFQIEFDSETKVVLTSQKTGAGMPTRWQFEGKFPFYREDTIVAGSAETVDMTVSKVENDQWKVSFGSLNGYNIRLFPDEAGSGDWQWPFMVTMEDFEMIHTAVSQSKEYTKMLSTSAVSNRGEYELAISGRIKLALNKGNNVLTLDQIKALPISVYAFNTKTDEDRLMNASTIEGMEIQTDGNKIISITIKGRVQTPGGKLDRYTTTINY